MDMTQLDQVARTALLARVEHPTREPGWLYHHGCRVGKLACWLADQIAAAVDRETLYAGALLHDVGKGRDPHNETGAALTHTLLTPFVPPADVETICTLVRHHNLRGNPQDSPAVKLVQDADILDHVGPVGTWLAFYWSGAQHETFDQHAAFILGAENAAYRAKLRSLLNFDSARTAFDRRIRYEDNFFRTFHQVYAAGVWEGD